MERKIKIETLVGFIGVEIDNEGYVYLDKGEDNITLTPHQAQQLHSALEDMLNPWRPISERPEFSGSYFATDGNKVEVVKFNSGWRDAYMLITHWKEIIKPNLPKL